MTDSKPKKIRYGTECFATVNPIPGALIEFRLDDDGNISDRKVMCFYERHEVTYEQAKLIEKRMNDYQVMLEFIKSLKNRGCCAMCECISCDALQVLREIGEAE